MCELNEITPKLVLLLVFSFVHHQLSCDERSLKLLVALYMVICVKSFCFGLDFIPIIQYPLSMMMSITVIFSEVGEEIVLHVLVLDVECCFQRF